MAWATFWATFYIKHWVTLLGHCDSLASDGCKGLPDSEVETTNKR
jgi:hypothetical protein